MARTVNVPVLAGRNVQKLPLPLVPGVGGRIVPLPGPPSTTTVTVVLGSVAGTPDSLALNITSEGCCDDESSAITMGFVAGNVTLIVTLWLATSTQSGVAALVTPFAD